MKRSLITVVLAGCVTLAGLACQPPYNYVLIGSNGQPIRQSQIDSIVQDSTMTTEQKRQALIDLGITDEGLINVLLGTSSTGS